MSLLARAKVTTPLALVPGETSFGVSRYLREGNTIRVYDTKKVGLKTFYSTKDNLYINAKDLQIVRDDEYFFANFKTRNLQKNNLGMTGAKGLTATLGDNNELSDMWTNLQLFSLSIDDTTVGGGFGGGIDNDQITVSVFPAFDNIGKVPDNYVENQPLTFEDIGTNIIHGVNETVNGITTMAAGQVNNYVDNVLNSDIAVGGFLGESGIMNGVSINSILNGTALNILMNNVMNALNDWIVNKLKYVVGFSLESAISGLFRLFGVNFKTAFSSGAYNMFGTAGLVNTSNGYHTNNSGRYYNYDTYKKRETKYDKVNIGTEGVYNDINWIERIHSGYGVHFFDVQFDSNHDPIYKEFKYAEVTQAMLNYFKYKGCDGRMIVKHYAGRTWVQDETYATPTLTPKKSQEEINLWKHQYDRPGMTASKSEDEIGFWKHQYNRPSMTPSKDPDDVKLWQNLYNSNYDELNDSLNIIKKQFDLTATRTDMVNKFNRFRVPVLDEELTHSRGYIFFTVPDLNLSMQWADNPFSKKYSALNNLMKGASSGSTARSARIMALTANFLKSHETLAKYLMGGVPGHKFIPLFTSRCSGIDVADEVLETTEYGETLTGWKYTYGTSMIKSKTAGNMSISFTDDKQLSIYLMIKIWCEYIHAVWRGESSPKQIYYTKHILDYAISIYYFLTDETGENIIFWTKYTGCFPTSVPSSNFSDSIGNVIHQPKYSVQFSFARKDDNNPMHLGEFNKLSKGGSFKYLPVYNKDSLKTHKSFVGPPFVDTIDGGYTFKLRFRGE